MNDVSLTSEEFCFTSPGDRTADIAGSPRSATNRHSQLHNGKAAIAAALLSSNST
jgi:hypothetical protein